MPPQKFNYKLTCAKCGTIYLRIPKFVTYKTMIHCSICDAVLGTWKELAREANIYMEAEPLRPCLYGQA